MKPLKSTLALALLASTMFVASVEARTLKWARAGDALTLDPHGQNEGPQQPSSTISMKP